MNWRVADNQFVCAHGQRGFGCVEIFLTDDRPLKRLRAILVTTGLILHVDAFR